MIAKLYVEASLCLETGGAGWGASLVRDGRATTAGGRVEAAVGGSTILLELAAVEQASLAFLPVLERGIELALCLRSTGALAVLRWVFPTAPFQGYIAVAPPKRLKRNVQEFQPLYELSERMEAKAAVMHLWLTAADSQSAAAYEIARAFMEHERIPHRQRSTR